MNALKKIQSSIACWIFMRVFFTCSHLSNRALIRLTYLAEKMLTRHDPVISRVLIELRKYFQVDHPCVAFIRRAISELSPRCKKTLVKTFFVSAIFRESGASRDYADKEGFTPPFFLALSPTMRCNLNCIGCSTRRYGKADDMPIALVDRILAEAGEMGIHFMVTQGGEMFVYEEMLDLYKKHRDIYFQVYTNGTLIDKKMAQTLAQLGNVAPMISLEGFKEATDARRGQGVFDKVMQAMDNLRSAGCFYGASVTQTAQNTEEIASDSFFQMLVDKGCYAAWFFQFLPIGKDPDTALMASPLQRTTLRRKVSEIRGKLPIFIGDFWGDGPLVGGCVAAGRRFAHINNKGDVEPCAFAHFSVDNIKDKTLKEALTSDFFKFIRSRQPFADGNLLTPCMIIDNPQVLREAVAQTGARATHEGAEVILSGGVKEGIEEYAAEIHRLTAADWDKMKDKAVKWQS